MTDAPPRGLTRRHRSATRLPPVQHAAEARVRGPSPHDRARPGSTVYDDQDRPYIDAMAGLWCVNVGYGRQELADAIYEQALRLPF